MRPPWAASWRRATRARCATGYGTARDLVVGITVALTDGTLARAGGRVIKNVAGYDLAKLFAGSFGTLGAIVEVCVRLHPLPAATVTARGRAPTPARLAAAARSLAHAQLELAVPRRALGGRRGRRPRPLGGRRAALGGGARGGRPARRRARHRARGGGRPPCGRPARGAAGRAGRPRVSGVQSQLGDAAGRGRRAGRRGRRAGRPGTVVAAPARRGRAAVEEVRRRLAPSPCVVLDAPDAVRAALDPWGPMDGALVAAHEDASTPSGCDPAAELAVTGFDDVRPAIAGHDRRLRALRLLPADVPDVRVVGRGDGLAARPHRADEGRRTRRPSCRAAMVEHFDRCLGCMACVTACPSGVRYDQLIEDTRAQVERRTTRPARASAAPRASSRCSRTPAACARWSRCSPSPGPGSPARSPGGPRRGARRRARPGRRCAPLCAGCRRLRRAGAGARQRRAAPGLRPAGVLRRRQPGGRRVLGAEGFDVHAPARAALLRRAPAARRRRGARPGAGAARRSSPSRATTTSWSPPRAAARR